MEKLLTVRELAKLLGVAEGSVYHWLSQERLPCIRFSQRCVRFRESDVQALLQTLHKPAATGDCCDVGCNSPRRSSRKNAI
jgi:excisionase family DNA binding protein